MGSKRETGRERWRLQVAGLTWAGGKGRIDPIPRPSPILPAPLAEPNPPALAPEHETTSGRSPGHCWPWDSWPWSVCARRAVPH
jgi:hypothetical protein